MINTARGELVDESALIHALENSQLSLACLDVFAQEPLSPDSPLWDMPNVICTPHTAGFSDAILQRMAEKFLENVGHFSRGEPLINVAKLA